MAAFLSAFAGYGSSMVGCGAFGIAAHGVVSNGMSFCVAGVTTLVAPLVRGSLRS